MQQFDEVFAGTMNEVKEFLTSDRIGRHIIINKVYDQTKQDIVFSVGIIHKKTKREKLKELKQQRKELEKEIKTLDRKIARLTKE